MKSRLALLFLCVAAALPAQESEEDDEHPSRGADITFSVDSRAHLTIFAEINGLSEKDHAALVGEIGKRLGCRWAVSVGFDFSSGVCRDWLSHNGDTDRGTLRLAAVTRVLHEHGIEQVNLRAYFGHRGSSAVPSGWKNHVGERRSQRWAEFTSNTPAEIPGDIQIVVQDPPRPARLFLPALVMLLLPPVSGWLIRRRVLTSCGHRINWMVWMTWIDLGAWLYWISAVHISDIADIPANMGIEAFPLQLLMGMFLFAGAPLAGIAAGLLALGPVVTTKPGRIWRMAGVRIAAESQVLVPLGIFSLSSELRSGGAAMYGVLIAYGAYRGLAWLNWHLNYAEAHPITSGGLFDRTFALAAKAGVPLKQLKLLRNREPEDTNAFASSDGAVTLTEGLVQGLTEREVDAVIAHELGHHRAGHLKFDFRAILFWLYILGFGPLLVFLLSTLRLPMWIASIPFGPVIYTLVQGRLSQRHEYAADHQAAELTGDPEGAIAALSRIAQVTRSPVRASGIMGSVLSHPAMELRILALGRAHGVPDERALAILDNPDEAYAGGTAQLARAVQNAQPESAPPTADLFNTRRRVGFGEQLHWLNFLSPLAGLLVFCSFVPWEFSRPRHLLLIAPMALVFGLLVRITVEVLWSRRFANRLRRSLAERLHPAPGAVFVGMNRGPGVRYTEGFPEWDFGFLTLDDNWLCFRGEKAAFAVHRTGVDRVSVVQGPRRWIRETRVQLEFEGGAITLNHDFARPTKSKAGRLRARIAGWVAARPQSGHWATTFSLPPEPPPPSWTVPEGDGQGRLSACWRLFKALFKNFFAGPALIYFGHNFGLMVLAGLLALVFPFLIYVPELLWPLHPAPAVTPTPVPATAETTAVAA